MLEYAAHQTLFSNTVFRNAALLKILNYLDLLNILDAGSDIRLCVSVRVSAQKHTPAPMYISLHVVFFQVFKVFCLL